MKIREYLTEGGIPRNVKIELGDLVNNPPKSSKKLEIQDYKVEISKWRLGTKFKYPSDFIELTITLTDICDTFEYKFTKTNTGKNTIFGVEHYNKKQYQR